MEGIISESCKMRLSNYRMVPPNGWFIREHREHPIKMDDLGVPLFVILGNLQMLLIFPSHPSVPRVWASSRVRSEIMPASNTS